MPKTISGSEIGNNFNEISSICHTSQEPVFITFNGQNDLALMSIELYESLIGRLELYRLLGEGRAAIDEGHKLPLSEAVAKLKRRRKERADG